MANDTEQASAKKLVSKDVRHNRQLSHYCASSRYVANATCVELMQTGTKRLSVSFLRRPTAFTFRLLQGKCIIKEYLHEQSYPDGRGGLSTESCLTGVESAPHKESLSNHSGKTAHGPGPRPDRLRSRHANCR